jgi:hypothetical protein
MVGHYVDNCKKLQSQENANKDFEPKQKPRTRVEKKYVKTNVVSAEQVKVTEVVDAIASKLPVEGGKSQPIIVADSAGESSKTRSQALPEASPVQVVHQNMFSNLFDAADEIVNSSQSKVCNVAAADVVEKNHDAAAADVVHFVEKNHDDAVADVENNFDDVEIEVVNDSDTSSQDSAFVDATQFQKEDTLADMQQPILTPVRVQNDMAFLKESWANMADLEDQNYAQGDTSASHLQEEGFQVKLSKNQKKAQKKLSQSSKDSYATRSKVSHKPFK